MLETNFVLAGGPDAAFAKAQQRVYAEIGEPLASIKEELSTALRALLNSGFPRTSSEGALRAVSAGQGKPVAGEAHAANAVDWLRQHDRRLPLYNEHEPLETEADTLQRCAAFLQWLAERPEAEVVVVSHFNFLRVLFGGGVTGVLNL